MELKGLQRGAVNGSGDAPIGIAMIGGAFFSTRQTFAYVEMEFQLRAVHVASLEDLLQLREDLSQLRLLIVDQVLLEDLLQRTGAYRSLNPAACLALGYRDPNKARQFLHRANDAKEDCIGFLPMDVSLEVLLASIRMLLHEQYFLPRNLLDHEAAPSAESSASTGEATYPCAIQGKKIERLTRREQEVLKLISEGDSNKGIAKRLGITEHTVKLHVHNLSGKLGAQNRTTAAKIYFAARRGENDGIG